MADESGLANARLRVARPTGDLGTVVKFYRDGLGFTVLYEFKDHDGFDGVMLGHKGAAYHSEFTRKKGHKVGKVSTEDNLLVFYSPDESEWKKANDWLAEQGYKPVKAFNPYWDKKGRTYEDPDGYRVVLQNAKWPNGCASVVLGVHHQGLNFGISVCGAISFTFWTVGVSSREEAWRRWATNCSTGSSGARAAACRGIQ